MGEIAEMMLDGTLCEGCGEFLDGEAPGFPRYCIACSEDDDDPQCATDRPRGKRSERDTPCPECGKMCRGEVGLAGHQHSKHFPQHAARFCAGYSTESLEGVTLEEVVRALLCLTNEAGGSFRMNEPGMRELIGNTNYHCLQERIEQADAILAHFQQGKSNG